MASTERSLGWATSGTGDGPAGGYDSSRWRANAQKSDGTGTTLFGSLLAMSGAGTSTLTIADGAAIINGYTYESNGSVTISTTALNGTYSIVLIANSTAGTVTVTANGAGTTTVAASTIRAAIATSAQVTTITTAVGASNIITLGTIVVATGTISTITSNWQMATSMQLTSQVYGIMNSLTSLISCGNTSATDITGYATSATDTSGIITANTTTGVFTVNMAGMYIIDARCVWDSNTTGSRELAVNGSGFPYGLDDQYSSILASAIVYTAEMQISGVVYLNAGATVKAFGRQNSGATRTISDAIFKIARM